MTANFERSEKTVHTLRFKVKVHDSVDPQTFVGGLLYELAHHNVKDSHVSYFHGSDYNKLNSNLNYYRISLIFRTLSDLKLAEQYIRDVLIRKMTGGFWNEELDWALV